jgi:hypothetical protein
MDAIQVQVWVDLDPSAPSHWAFIADPGDDICTQTPYTYTYTYTEREREREREREDENKTIVLILCDIWFC